MNVDARLDEIERVANTIEHRIELDGDDGRLLHLACLTVAARTIGRQAATRSSLEQGVQLAAMYFGSTAVKEFEHI